ncbi:MAG TPA: hypothetical protein VH352_11990 [Pseudonocardiaceae bacterium]|nr:hypothetical protein [Pseudonocardiaceae bacterium]
MDFWKTIGVLLRRWYVAVPVFVVALGIGGGVFLKVPTQYQATGTIVLTAPTAGGVTAIDPSKASGPGNPLLDFEGSLTITTQLLIQSLSSPSVGQQIVSEGGASYQAGDGNTGGPFVVIIATANSPQQSELTVSLALKYAQTELDARQKNLNAPPSTYIGTQSVVSPTTATTKISNKVKDAGIALVLGLIIALGAAYGIESFTGRRRRSGDDDDDLRADVELDDDGDTVDESALPTKQMRPAPPPRPMPAPQPVRAGGPRPSPHPQSVGDRSANGARREPYSPAPVHQPHPVKPRPLPAPVPTNNGHAGGTSTSDSASNANGNNGNGTANRHDWPRTEFRSPDSSAG